MMRKILIFTLFFVTLLPLLPQLDSATVHAQGIANENYYLCYIGGTIQTSIQPCDKDEEITVIICKKCGEQYMNYETHKCPDDDNKIQCPHCGKMLTPEENATHKCKENGDTGTSNGGTLPDLDVPGNRPGGTNQGNNNNGSIGNTGGTEGSVGIVYPPDKINDGKAAFNKMENDLQSGNYQTWVASVESSKKLSQTEKLSNTFLDISTVDLILNRVNAIKTNPMYFAVSQSLAHAGIGVSMAQTAVLLTEKGFSNLNTGDIMNIASGAICGIGVFTGYFNKPLGLFINGAGIVVGWMAPYFYLNEMYIPLEDGNVLHLKRIQA